MLFHLILAFHGQVGLSEKQNEAALILLATSCHFVCSHVTLTSIVSQRVDAEKKGLSGVEWSENCWLELEITTRCDCYRADRLNCVYMDLYLRGELIRLLLCWGNCKKWVVACVYKVHSLKPNRDKITERKNTAILHRGRKIVILKSLSWHVSWPDIHGVNHFWTYINMMVTSCVYVCTWFTAMDWHPVQGVFLPWSCMEYNCLLKINM